jgi:hypothetical protein
MKDFPFGTFGPEHLKKVKAGIETFNNQQYWECHEELEEIWLEDRNDPARNVYWAIIQVAASMYHVREKNIQGAQGLINKAKEKFKRCRDQNINTELVFRFLDWEELEALTFEVKDEDSKLSDYEKLYNFRFKNYPYL